MLSYSAMHSPQCSEDISNWNTYPQVQGTLHAQITAIGERKQLPLGKLESITRKGLRRGPFGSSIIFWRKSHCPGAGEPLMIHCLGGDVECNAGLFGMIASNIAKVISNLCTLLHWGNTGLLSPGIPKRSLWIHWCST